MSEKMILRNSRPENIDERLEKEVMCYDFLDKLNIEYCLVDHDEAKDMDACVKIEDVLGAPICKNLLLTNRQQTEFYLLLMPGDKPFKTKELSKQIDSARLSFASSEQMEKYLNVTPGSVSIMGLMFDKEKKVQLIVDEDIKKNEYFGCHPCINTSTLRIKTTDVFDTLTDALEHKYMVVNLIGE